MPGVRIQWTREDSRAGEPTLQLGDRFVHSRYAPKREAADLARRTRQELEQDPRRQLVLLGLGLGYLPQALCDEFDTEILAWDPFPETTHELADVYASNPARLRVVTDIEEVESALRELAGRGRIPHLLLHPGYADLCRFETRWFQEVLRELFGAKRKTELASAIVSQRSLDAMLRIPQRRRIDSLADCCQGQTAIVVAPGPSLDAALPVLAQRRSGVVFAAIQALRKLNEAGVHVDFVVAPDPLRFEHFLEGFEPSFDVLLADSSVEPALLDRWPEKTVLFHLRTPHLHGVAWEKAGLPVLDDALTTVSDTALALARDLGANRFVLAGVDLCGEADRYVRHRFPAFDMHGAPVVTNTHYLGTAKYISHLSPRLAAAGRPVSRLEAGHQLALEGVDAISPDELAALLAEAAAFELPAPGPLFLPALHKAARRVLERVVAGPLGGPQRPVQDLGQGRARERWRDFEEIAPERRRAACAAALTALKDLECLGAPQRVEWSQPQ